MAAKKKAKKAKGAEIFLMTEGGYDYYITKNRLEERDGSDVRRYLKREDLVVALKKSSDVTVFEREEESDDAEFFSAEYEVTSYDRIEIGCKEFEDDAARAIREWANGGKSD